MNRGIADRRLQNESITGAGRRRAADVVSWLGAVQSQEFAPAKWAVGLRMREGTTDAEIERAFNDGRILRTHVLRPTWHFVTPEDIRWMLELTAPHVHRAMASYNRRLGLDADVLHLGTAVIERALGAGDYLTRQELRAHLERAGIRGSGNWLAHLVMHAELERVICSGPRRGKQMTYALFDERAPSARSLPRDEALAELAFRYFRSHGPATVRDFVWWSGLSTADAKRALEMNRARPEEGDGRTYWTIGRVPRRRPSEDNVHLLPIYDEYVVAFRDRHAVPHPQAGTITFQHVLVIDGQVAGSWTTSQNARGVTVEVIPLRPLTRLERRGIAKAADRYGRFLELPVSVTTPVVKRA